MTARTRKLTGLGNCAKSLLRERRNVRVHRIASGGRLTSADLSTSRGSTRRHLEYGRRITSHELRMVLPSSDRNHDRQRDRAQQQRKSPAISRLLRSDPIAETLDAFGLGAMLAAIELIVSF